MQVKDVMYPEKYTHNGEEKTKWHNCGTLFIKDDGKISLKLTLIPVNFDGQMQVFDKKPREDQNQNNGGHNQQQNNGYGQQQQGGGYQQQQQGYDQQQGQH